MFDGQLLGPHAAAQRYLNTVSPNKMLLQDLASGQGNIGTTPPRSRLDSQEIRISEFSTLKCHEILTDPKTGRINFQSPSLKHGLPTTPFNQGYGSSAIMGGVAHRS